MFDNVKVKIIFIPPDIFFSGLVGSVTYNNIIYNPGFNAEGMLVRYETKVRNLLIRIYPGYAVLTNSIHKFYFGTNSNDFHLQDAVRAFGYLTRLTGIDWNEATAYVIESGVNILAKIGSYKSLGSYKGKDYQPMVSSGGRPYGCKCSFEDNYELKFYDKTFEAWQTAGIRVGEQMYRWEVVAKPPLLKRLFDGKLPRVKDLLTPEAFEIFKNDAMDKFKTTVKQGQLNLNGLSTAENKILAVMQNPTIREYMKNHHQATYKRDKAIYRKLMATTSVVGTDGTAALLNEKFDQLISGTQPCSIPRNIPNILTLPINITTELINIGSDPDKSNYKINYMQEQKPIKAEPNLKPSPRHIKLFKELKKDPAWQQADPPGKLRISLLRWTKIDRYRVTA